MAFKIFVLWSFVVLGRPQDLLIALQPLRPALLFTLLSMGSSFFGTNGTAWQSAFRIPETKKYLLFFLIMIVGIPFAYHRRVAFEAIFLGYLPNILFFLVFVLEVDSLKKLKVVLFVICLCTFFYGFFGLLEGGFTQGRFETYGEIFDPNDIAYVLISLLPFSFYFVFCREGAPKKILAVVGVVSALVVILYSGSRGGMLGLIALVGFFLLTRIDHIRRSHKSILVMAGFILLLFIGAKINVDRYLTLTSIESDYNISDEFGRGQLWKRALGLIVSNPLTGVGVECSPMAIGYAREALGIIPKWQVLHNSYLQVATETGVVGFVVFVSLIGRSLRIFWETKSFTGSSKESSEIRMIAGLAYLGFIGHLITALFLSQGYSMFFTLFFALSVTLRQLTRKTSEISWEPLVPKRAPMRSLQHSV